MTNLEIVAISFSLIGLLLIGSLKETRRLMGFVTNIGGCIMWCIAIPMPSIWIINGCFIAVNLYNAIKLTNSITLGAIHVQEYK